MTTHDITIHDITTSRHHDSRHHDITIHDITIHDITTSRMFSRHSFKYPIFTITAVVVLIVAAIHFLGGSNTNGNPVEMVTADVSEGKPAPDFTLRDLDGESYSLADFKGKVLMLNFWATWCPPCQTEIPDFVEFEERFSPQGFEIVGVALDKPDALETFLSGTEINYTILVGDEIIATLYGNVRTIPTTFLIGRDGVIRHVVVGTRPKDEWIKPIGELVGQSVE